MQAPCLTFSSKPLVAPNLAAVYALRMATNKEMRLARLKALLGEHGSAAVAQKLEVSPAYVSQLKRGERNVGDKMARKLETAFGKKVGWMDNADPSPGPLDIKVGGRNVRVEPMRDMLLRMFDGLSETRQNTLIGAANRLWAEEHHGASAESPFPAKPRVPQDN